MMGPDQQRLTPEDRSNLVAYLDGELDDDQARALATKLTQSTTARREVDAFRKTWELLDLLPRPGASEDFASRTLALATATGPEARMASAASVASVVGRKASLSLACVGTAALLFAVGYFLVAWLWPNPTARLVRDLSIAESLDEYLEVGSFEYLERIDLAPELN